MYFIFGNYGDNTIAILHWAYLNQLNDVIVIHINTGLGSSCWKTRVTKGIQLAEQYGFKTKELKPTHDFPTLIRDRHDFPTAKYNWCSTFLKALPFLSFLDEVDEQGEGVIILGSRRDDSRARQNLPEFIEESEHYGDRKIWFPLFNATQKERDRLITEAGFEILNRRSFECQPCIHSRVSELVHLENDKKVVIEDLEKDIGVPMFHARFANVPIAQLVNNTPQKTTPAVHNQLENFDMGCGAKYACGE